TNTIISLLFFIEPAHSVINKYLEGNSNDKFYYTKHIYSECETIFRQKLDFLDDIIEDVILFLEDNHNKMYNQKQFTSSFTNSNKNYYYKQSKVDINDIISILSIIWDKHCSENMDGFYLSQIFFKYQHFLDNYLIKYKQTIYNRLILINGYTQEYPQITDKLLSHGSHKKDNEIILDIYEYHLKHNILFNFVTFDKSFYNALKECNFDFLIEIYDYECIKTFVN
ncbi:MAG: hypothetical protein Q4Q22_07415, partial [Methanosphaera sp.]|nr:hypothetical protein [Methanosphaera sp.]